MKRLTSLTALAALAVLAALTACSHDHGPEAGGHAHGEGGDHAPHGDEPDELEGVAVTLWTERTELFMEYRPLIVGAESSFAAHVTEMPSFKAVTAGSMRVDLVMTGGATQSATAERPSNPGIFRPTLTPSQAGPCKLVLTIASPQLEDLIEVSPCIVHRDEAEARTAAPTDEGPAGITFLKEQQWTTDFATEPAAPRALQSRVRALGTIRPAAGGEARVHASDSGWMGGEALPALGTRIERGQLLATVVRRPGGESQRAPLNAELRVGKAELEQTRTQLARLERLASDGAASRTEVEEARTRVAVARYRVESATARLAQFDATLQGKGVDKGLEVRAPIAGTLVGIEVVAGQPIEAGQALFHIVDLDEVWLEAHVFERDLPRIADATSATFRVPGDERHHTVPPGRRVEVGRVLDPERRTARVVFALDNRASRFWVGQSAEVEIGVGAPRETLAIPRRALIAEAGREVVYVMSGGESFERRPLTLGVSDGGFVEVVAGLAPGERVVTVGGYEIRLAAASGIIPAHGHAH